MVARWLMKTEPADYSWERLVADGKTEWDGVRNHQAAANMRAMKKGDKVFFYRSLKAPAVVGIMEITREAFPDPDPNNTDGKWVRVEVAPVEPLPAEVSLKAIKADARLNDLALVRQSRLSVMPVSEAHWQLICQMAEDAA